MIYVYGHNLETFKNLLHFNIHLTKISVLAINILKLTFPDISTLLQIYSIMPISNASGERSYSILKIIKKLFEIDKRAKSFRFSGIIKY